MRNNKSKGNNVSHEDTLELSMTPNAVVNSSFNSKDQQYDQTSPASESFNRNPPAVQNVDEINYLMTYLLSHGRDGKRFTY